MLLHFMKTVCLFCPQVQSCCYCKCGLNLGKQPILPCSFSKRHWSLWKRCFLIVRIFTNNLKQSVLISCSKCGSIWLNKSLLAFSACKGKCCETCRKQSVSIAFGNCGQTFWKHAPLVVLVHIASLDANILRTPFEILKYLVMKPTFDSTFCITIYC